MKMRKKNFIRMFRRKQLATLTDHLEVALPRSHRIGVHLAHVPTAVRLLHLSNVQVPAAVVVVGQHDARILCDDVVVNAENRLRVHPHPRDLQQRMRGNEMSSVKLQLNEIMS